MALHRAARLSPANVSRTILDLNELKTETVVPSLVFMSQTFLMLALLLAIGWGWPRQAQACGGANCPDESGSIVLVVDTVAGHEGAQAVETRDLELRNAPFL